MLNDGVYVCEAYVVWGNGKPSQLNVVTLSAYYHSYNTNPIVVITSH